MRKRKILKVLVTAGPTQEMIDPVRFISNRSTGVMGYEIAKEARRRHHKVTLISGPTYIEPPAGIKFIPIKTVDELKNKILSHLRKSDCLFMVAAVSDFKVARFSGNKIKRGVKGLKLFLKPTPDILKLAGRIKGKRILVGFSLETQEGLGISREKLKNKNLDIIVSNSITKTKNPFGDKRIKSSIIYKTGDVESMPFLTKKEIAKILLYKVEALYRKKFSGGVPKQLRERSAPHVETSLE